MSNKESYAGSLGFFGGRKLDRVLGSHDWTQKAAV